MISYVSKSLSDYSSEQWKVFHHYLETKIFFQWNETVSKTFNLNFSLWSKSTDFDVLMHTLCWISYIKNWAGAHEI